MGLTLAVARGPGQTPARVTAAGVWTGTRTVPVRDVRLMPTGYPSVTALLAQGQPCIAHRGGSLAYPEMSLQAYTYSLMRGYGAMELSLALTSDGVWFGAHDQYLDRVVTGTPGTTMLASAMTWEEVSHVTIRPPAGRPVDAQPFMRLEDYLATYADHVVTFVDVKYARWQAWAPLLDILDDHGGPARWIAKFSGPGSKSHGWLPLARSRGYLTWGYGYAADAATLDTWADDVDLLGCDYTAPQSAWDAYRATGKRVIAHIIPDAAAAAQAIARGAQGLMVSGTHLVT